MGLEISQTQGADSTVVELQGELDLAGAARFAQQITDLIARSERAIVVDLRSLDFMDSTGLSVLIRTRREAAAAGMDFHLRQGNSRIQLLLERSGTLDEFSFV